MKNFVIGSVGLQTRRLSPNDLSEPKQDVLAVRSPPPTKASGFSAPLDTKKFTSRVSPLRSPTRDSRVEKAPYMRRSSRTNASPSIDPAKQSILVDSSPPQDDSEQSKLDQTLVLQDFLVPTTGTTVSLRENCPRIDLVALVREKQKARKLHRKKLSAFPLSKELRRRVIPQDLSSNKTR